MVFAGDNWRAGYTGKRAMVMGDPVRIQRYNPMDDGHSAYTTDPVPEPRWTNDLELLAGIVVLVVGLVLVALEFTWFI